jgi:O-antigen ligase
MGEAINLYLDHPLLGNGLGALLLEHHSTPGVLLPTQSTFLWILTDFGFLGFMGFAMLFCLLLWRLSPGFKPDQAHPRMIFGFMILVAFFLASLFHDMLYQRSMWLLMGAVLASPLSKQNEQPPKNLASVASLTRP